MNKNSLNNNVSKNDDVIQMEIENFNDNSFDINQIYDINNYDFNKNNDIFM